MNIEHKKRLSILSQLMNLPHHSKINTTCPGCNSDKVGLTNFELMTKEVDKFTVFIFFCKKCGETWDPPDDYDELVNLKPKKF